MNAINIRRADAQDADTLLELIEALAHYEHLEPPDAEARSRLVEHGFGPRPRFEAYLAECEDAAVGYALVFDTYSTFLARPTLYLEDLFVEPGARGEGAGKALLRRLAERCVEADLGRLEWAVLDWNAPSIAFYDSLGAMKKDGWTVRRLYGDALNELAAG